MLVPSKSVQLFGSAVWGGAGHKTTGRVSVVPVDDAFDNGFVRIEFVDVVPLEDGARLETWRGFGIDGHVRRERFVAVSGEWKPVCGQYWNHEKDVWVDGYGRPLNGEEKWTPQ